MIYLRVFAILSICFLLLIGCKPQKAEQYKVTQIGEKEYEPAVWGQNFPVHYDMYKASAEPTPAGKSKYKKGWDTDNVMYDKLSEFPFLAYIYQGLGFSIYYFEPRSHYYRVIDVLDADPSRYKPGGVCLTCKTPYAPELEAKHGLAYYQTPFREALNWIPEKHQKLGDSCTDCHNPKDASLKISREFTLGKALQTLGVDRNKLTVRDMRSLVCAQCHVTYVIPRDKDMKPTGIFFPWQGSKVGEISIENIIKVLKSDPSYGEWKQAPTGFKLAFIRHPEYELFTYNSVHYNAGLSCSDCHMNFIKKGSYKVSQHHIMSPLKADMKACLQCHSQTPEWLKNQVIAIQDRTISLINRAGWQVAVTTKLFEIANKAAEEGKKIDQKIYEKAKDFYLEAIYRLIFVVAENSVGFHNPTEAMRILADSSAFASKAEALLRTALQQAGVTVPVNVEEEIKKELPKYQNNRGQKKLMAKPEQEFKDPFGVQAYISK